jgi:acyl dehydratase
VYIFQFCEEKVEAFAKLTGDYAPVHFDKNHAEEMGFSNRIVHGFFVQSVCSTVLGNHFPGPNSVINTCSFKFHLPIYVGDTVKFIFSETKSSPAVAATVIGVTGFSEKTSQKVLSGSVMCSYRKA